MRWNKFRLVSAAKISALHFALSCIAASLTALLVFRLWYPWPLNEMMNINKLFILILIIDIICGPFLTLILWNPKKSRTEHAVDISLIAFIQIGAFFYGIYIMAMMRPVYMAFEADRIRAVSAAEIEQSELIGAPSELRNFPWLGPQLISIRDPVSAEELIKSVEASIAGKEPSLRPDWWQNYNTKLPAIISKAQKIEILESARPDKRDILAKAVYDAGMPVSELLWLPLTSEKSMEWIVIIDKAKGRPRAYAPIDGFLQ